MNEDQNTTNEDLLSILDGNVSEVAAALPPLTAEQLDELKFAEESGKTRKGVIEAIVAEHNRRAEAAQKDAEQPAPATRSVEDIEAEIEKLEAGAIDIKVAERLHRLRLERSEAVK